jgi:hypothetical protein
LNRHEFERKANNKQARPFPSIIASSRSDEYSFLWRDSASTKLLSSIMSTSSQVTFFEFVGKYVRFVCQFAPFGDGPQTPDGDFGELSGRYVTGKFNESLWPGNFT